MVEDHTDLLSQKSLSEALAAGHHEEKAAAGGRMHKEIRIRVAIEEDDTNTLAHAILDMGGDHFNVTGSARRSPEDRSIPLIGEELAVARALKSLESDLIDAAYLRIEGGVLR